MNKLRRMDIPYKNEYMENVRILAVKHIKELISEFVNDLKESDEDLYKIEGYYGFNRDLIKKWEEKTK